MRPFVSGLVLAAGASTRLGRPKQLLPFGSTTLLGAVVAEASAAAALDELVVVLGGAAAEMRRQVDLGRAKVTENPEFGEGCSSSYRTGLGVLDPRAEAVVILLASYRGREGHPLVFAHTLFPELVALQGDKAAWKIVDRRRAEIRTVPLDQPHPRDVNTAEDYEALLREIAASR